MGDFVIEHFRSTDFHTVLIINLYGLNYFVANKRIDIVVIISKL